MIRNDVRQHTIALPAASISDQRPAHRLIVLVPEFEVNSTLVAQKIWELANISGCSVLFIGLCKDAAREPALRRQLVTLSAMVGNENIPTETKIGFGNNWLNAVTPECHTGDRIACFAEQNLGFAHKPLSQILESNLNATVYVLPGLYQQEKGTRSSWAFHALAWIGSIGIILGFFWLQLKFTQSPGDWVYTALFYISIFAEAGLVWAWNSLFS